MSNFQIKTIEQNNSYPLGQFRALNKMEMLFWQEERVRQNMMLEEIELKNPKLDLDIPDGVNMQSRQHFATLYNVKDVDLLTRFSDADREIPNDISFRIKDLGSLRNQNKFLETYLSDFDTYTESMDIQFKDDNHKEQVKQALTDFYNKREETINMTKEQISKDMDAMNIPAFDEKGRDLSSPDTFDNDRAISVTGKSIEQGMEIVSERQAEAAAEQIIAEINENLKQIEELEKKYDAMIKEMADAEAEKNAEVERQMKERAERTENLESKLEGELEQLKERLDRELSEKTESIKKEMEEMQAETDRLKKENEMFQNEVDIILGKKDFDKQNENSIEISFDDLTKEGTQRTPSKIQSFFDSVGKVLSTAWADLMSHFKPLEPTNAPEKPKFEITAPYNAHKMDEPQKEKEAPVKSNDSMTK
ncbi:MAG: hypothetical protein FWH10_04260 [Oscillospiraceae bacterium]|nr:hypothetical protein [Oscillospiraceae bacterium]